MFQSSISKQMQCHSLNLYKVEYNHKFYDAHFYSGYFQFFIYICISTSTLYSVLFHYSIPFQRSVADFIDHVSPTGLPACATMLVMGVHRNFFLVQAGWFDFSGGFTSLSVLTLSHVPFRPSQDCQAFPLRAAQPINLTRDLTCFMTHITRCRYSERFETFVADCSTVLWFGQFVV
jgi:hypothetical protein